MIKATREIETKKPFPPPPRELLEGKQKGTLKGRVNNSASLIQAVVSKGNSLT